VASGYIGKTKYETVSETIDAAPQPLRDRYELLVSHLSALTM
jgi:hypothetical protein